MHFINCSYNDFINKTKNKKIIQFGASTAWGYYESLFPDIYAKVVEKTDYIVDNSDEKIGTEWDVLGKRIQVKNPDVICDQQNFIILLTVRLGFQNKICEQLVSYNLPDEIECYSLQLMIYEGNEADNKCVYEYFKTHTENQIPAKIHSFWFSGEEKPDKYKKCIDSWYKFCPDFEICEWNGDNYDVTKNKYMEQAFLHKKWAFVSDYARLDVVHQYGGIYFDMDVELIAPIDKMLNATAFFCRQNDGLLELGSGFGATKSHVLIKQMLNVYKELEFVNSDGTLDMTPQPSRLTSAFYNLGVTRTHNSQVINDTIFLSNDYFTCINGEPDKWSWKGTEMGIHWHNAGWMNIDKRQSIEVDKDIIKKLLESYFTERVD